MELRQFYDPTCLSDIRWSSATAIQGWVTPLILHSRCVLGGV
jgi:hypothetical protein